MINRRLRFQFHFQSVEIHHMQQLQMSNMHHIPLGSLSRSRCHFSSNPDLLVQFQQLGRLFQEFRQLGPLIFNQLQVVYVLHLNQFTLSFFIGAVCELIDSHSILNTGVILHLFQLCNSTVVNLLSFGILFIPRVLLREIFDILGESRKFHNFLTSRRWIPNSLHLNSNTNTTEQLTMDIIIKNIDHRIVVFLYPDCTEFMRLLFVQAYQIFIVKNSKEDKNINIVPSRHFSRFDKQIDNNALAMRPVRIKSIKPEQKQVNKQTDNPYNNYQLDQTVMGKDHERVLQLNSLLSKLLDSLCFQVCVNRRDDNCISLLQILIWRKKGEVDEQQFIELYRSWLESKSIFDLHTCKQVEMYPKNEFILQDIVQQNFFSVTQINKALEMINSAYNKLYEQKKPNYSHQLQQAQKIFSYLDSAGYIHLRLSNIFFFTGATVILERYTVPINYDAFRIHMNDLRKQTCQINGIVSLRCFKNYLLNLNSVKRTNYLDNLLNIFSEIETAIGGDKNCMPNLFEQIFQKWRVFPRFTSNENRKNLEIYRRVFEQNQRVFFDEGASLQYFLQKYGEEFVKCFQIDTPLLRQFNVLLKQSLNRYIEIFARVSQKLVKNSTNHEKSNNSILSHRKKQGSDLHQPKLHSKMPSMKDRTPTKSQKTIEIKNTKTPTKTYNNQAKIRKQFGSTEKSKQKTLGHRQLTPTKSFRQSGLNQSQAYTASQKSAIKVGVQADSFYNKMLFFRNKRVESYQVVMKRLKGK